MALRSILVYPDPELRRVSAVVERRTDELATLIADLQETLDSLPGCVGIAAPQVGAHHRLVIVDASRYRKPVPNQGRMVLINPVQKSASGRGMFREGCLSLPDFTANVPRATDVQYEALDENLQPRTIAATGFEAVVMQHECDHLDGVLFIDRVVCVKTDLFRRKKYL
jgi:peptide deformylase